MGRMLRPPPPAAPFEYDPWHIDASSPTDVREHIKRLVKDYERAWLAQVEEVEEDARQTGLGMLAARRRSEKHLRLMATRLCRRAVLGMSYQRIAKAEQTAGHVKPNEPVEDTAVEKSIKAWAKMLDVPLPDVHGSTFAKSA
jgi:hypothetical protein